MTVRLRYAPSPTGHLHIGGARTALFNYLFARRHHGVFILRIEDTDTERNVTHAAADFTEGLRWLGVEWDEGIEVGGAHGPYSCMERLPVYDEHVRLLRQAGRAYECYCSEEELEAAREAALAAGEAPRYSGKCRHLSEAQRSALRLSGRSPVVRFRVPDEGEVEFTDLVRGSLTFDAASVGGDFVIVKSNGIPTYNFACVIDDHLMAITHAIRGEEHISNTPRQLYLYAAFGWEPPIFGHLALILGPDGRKLSKRDESIMQFIEQYRSLGYLPEAVFNFLALLGWSPGGEQEIFSRAELIALFSFDRVTRSGAFFDPARLAWMNGQYIKGRSALQLLPAARPHLEPFDALMQMEAGPGWMVDMIELYREKVSCLSEIPKLGAPLLGTAATYDREAAELLASPSSHRVLRALEAGLDSAGPWNVDEVKALLKGLQTRLGVKGKDLFMPVRAALLGQLHGADLNRSLVILGRGRALTRTQDALARFVSGATDGRA